MRIRIFSIILFILLTVSIAEAAQKNPPPMPLKLPVNVSWVQTTLTTWEDGSRGYRRQAFVARGKKWRLEYELFNKATTVIIFDGKSMKANGKINEAIEPKYKKPETWDARSLVHELYNLILPKDYQEIVQLENYKCWYFIAQAGELTVKLWVDVKKRIPRRLFYENQDGRADHELFDDLPDHIRITQELFDTKNLQVILLKR